MLIKSNICFQIFDLKFLAIFLLFILFFEFVNFFPFKKRIVKLRKFKTEETRCLGVEGLIQLFRPKISPN